ncbi:MAG TPA: 30S ribosomal protein S17 [Planctomycetota bacterium]|nr:30S ribosomal protein S17 [Planctomycetota bacterium]
MTTERKTKKTVTGEVISNSMQKTIAVASEKFVKHPIYRKYIRRATVYKAHDEKSEAKVGDKVRIEESRPLSKTKRWKLVEIVQRGPEG